MPTPTSTGTTPTSTPPEAAQLPAQRAARAAELASPAAVQLRASIRTLSAAIHAQERPMHMPWPRYRRPVRTAADAVAAAAQLRAAGWVVRDHGALLPCAPCGNRAPRPHAPTIYPPADPAPQGVTPWLSLALAAAVGLVAAGACTALVLAAAAGAR